MAVKKRNIWQVNPLVVALSRTIFSYLVICIFHLGMRRVVSQCTQKVIPFGPETAITAGESLLTALDMRRALKVEAAALACSRGMDEDLEPCKTHELSDRGEIDRHS
jgi:hypothetical protein